MKSQCLPFQQIPHTSRLFLDYLAFSPDVQQFYPRSPRFLEWAADEVSRLQYPSQRRQQVANLLERQNRAWSASASALENISKFRAGACAVVTGQQVGLFGGPMFSIYKALSAVKLAEEARKLGVNCVPIFWLATEDHDIAEVNQANLPIGDGHLEHLSSPTHARPDAAVGSVAFGQEISAVVDRAAELLGQTEVTALLSEAFQSLEIDV